MAYQFPASDLDRPERLRDVLGDFWAEVYPDGGAVVDLLAARLTLQRQNFADLDALQASVNRFRCPVFRTLLWSPLTLSAAARDRSGARYGFAGTFGAASAYGADGRGLRHVWPVPAGLVRAPLLCNRMHDAGVVWVEGVDYVIADGQIAFQADPFARTDLAGDDQTVVLWAYQARYDVQFYANQHGYVFGVRLPASEPAKAAGNAVYDAAVQGTTTLSLIELVAAAADAPIAREDGEVVETVLAGPSAKWIVTSRHAYRAGAGSAAVVAAGDVLRAGQALTNAFALLHFHDGAGWESLRALAIGRGLLTVGFGDGLAFINQTTPWVVEENVRGFTKLSFAVGGPADRAMQFWDEVHDRGIAAGQTLAQRLDVRPTPSGEPGPGSLPKTVNPLAFLCGQLFRTNIGVLRLRPMSYGPDAVPEALRLLGKLVPLGAALVVVTELQHADAAITMDGPGDALAPGGSTDMAWTANLFLTESVGPDDVTARARLVSPGVQCA